jgi:hypothetical protein
MSARKHAAKRGGLQQQIDWGSQDMGVGHSASFLFGGRLVVHEMVNVLL